MLAYLGPMQYPSAAQPATFKAPNGLALKYELIIKPVQCTSCDVNEFDDFHKQFEPIHLPNPVDQINILNYSFH